MRGFRFLDDAAPHRSVLVSDFDGTIAHPDFYQLVRSRLLPKTTPDFWQAYRNGEISHFDALRRYFAAAEGGQAAFLSLLKDICLPSELPELVKRLGDHEWSVIVVSAGCQWYIDRLLQRAGVELPVLTNPGTIQEGRLLMTLPEPSPFFSEENGVDKSAVVTALINSGKTVAYCGDGYTDFPAARLVHHELRFARADLAEACIRENVPFQPFEGWEDVVNGLLNAGDRQTRVAR